MENPLVLEQIDFEDVIISYPITTQYADLGVVFDGGLAASTEIDGAFPRDLQAGQLSALGTTLTFTEIQPAVSFYAIDVAANLEVTGYADGVLLYHYPIEVYSEGGASFIGLGFDYGVDTLHIESDTMLDEWGIDDVYFSQLGLDDADGDGLSEAEGDCNDNDATIFPNATETWYDGIDSDCVGDSDYDSDGDGHISSDWGGTDCDDSMGIGWFSKHSTGINSSFFD